MTKKDFTDRVGACIVKNLADNVTMKDINKHVKECLEAKKKKPSVRVVALKDISKYMSEQNIQIQDENGDVWVVSASRLGCKEQIHLNIELGVSKVNYTKDSMARYKKRKGSR